MGPQRSGTLITYLIVTKIEVMQCTEAGEMGHQRSGTLRTYIIVTKIEVMQ